MISITRDIHSLTSFKRDTSKFISRLKKTGSPAILTVNGKAKVVVQDAESYQRLLDFAEQRDAIEGIQQGLEDMKAGRSVPWEVVKKNLERRLRLKRRR